MIQQGDVLIRRINAVPAGAAVRHGRIILAEGEATGHCHETKEQEGVTLYTLDEILYFVTDHEVTVSHQEHGPVTVSPGFYQIGIVREWDYTKHEVKRVVD